VLVGGRDQLGAVDRLERGRAAQAAVQPLAREAQRGWERAAVEAGDHLHQAVFVTALDLATLEVAHPGRLAVPVAPRRDRVAQQVQLHAALALARPDVGQRAPQLGMPQQRRQVVDRDDHADVVDRAVRHRADRPVGDGSPAKQPDVARSGRGDGVVQRHGCLIFHGA
jgi:hypothetical protein